MLEVGRVVPPLPDKEFTWNRAHFGSWCIVSAPLILGLDITNNDKLSPILEIIGNKEAVKINQEWSGHPGMLVLNLVPPPQQANINGVTVPSSSPGDFALFGGAGITGGRADAKTSGASNIRTGGPGGTGLVEIGTGIVSNDGALVIDSLKMEFRYTAGYTGGKKASVVSCQLLNMNTRAVLKTIWTSHALGNYSWDHGDPNSPPIVIAVDKLAVALPASGDPVIVALSISNNDRNLQIPVDDKGKGFNLQLGFVAAERSPQSARAHRRVHTSSWVGISPYHGSVPRGNAQIWAKPQLHGEMAVLLINHGSQIIQSFSLSLSMLNLTASQRYDVLDVWTQSSRAPAAGGGTTTAKGNLTFSNVASYDSQFVRLAPTS
jgi:hypothetical protein